ncbi:MAG: hypothetical protein ABI811_14300 [Acidobacteriota bacterium]
MMRPVLVFLALALAFSLVAAAQTPDLSGVWVVSGSPDIAGTPAYKPEALKILQQNRANLKEKDPATYCLPNGVVRVTNLPYKIVQTPKLVVILSEGNTHSFRRLFVDGRAHNLEVEPESWTGDSIAKWEGDALVVDTIGLNDRTWLDSSGKPHSEELHIVERYRRASATRLEVQYTLDDPKAFTKPFTFTRTFTLQPNREIQERFCTDQNHLAGKQ